MNMPYLHVTGVVQGRNKTWSPLIQVVSSSQLMWGYVAVYVLALSLYIAIMVWTACEDLCLTCCERLAFPVTQSHLGSACTDTALPLAEGLTYMCIYTCSTASDSRCIHYAVALPVFRLKVCIHSPSFFQMTLSSCVPSLSPNLFCMCYMPVGLRVMGGVIGPCSWLAINFSSYCSRYIPQYAMSQLKHWEVNSQCEM